MMRSLSLQQLVDRFGGELINGDFQFEQVSIDSRQALAGAAFVALCGERFDGHDFLEQALVNGVGALVVNSRSQDKLPVQALPTWLVEDTTAALANMASAQRDYFTHKIVGITGSSGKTTLKGMLSAIFIALVGKQQCFVTPGNFNNHIGVPLSLFKIKPQHRYVAIEMGASALGDIHYLTTITRPHVAVVNNVMPAHLEGFGSVDNIARAKGEIYEGLSGESIAVINGDDAYAQQWIVQNRQRRQIIFSAKGRDDAVVTASNIEKLPNGCYGFLLHCGDQQASVQLSVLGVHNIHNALAAAACAHALHINIQQIATGLANFVAEPGRLYVQQGIDNCVLIDDTYNANPGSVKAAINVLCDLPGKKTLVLGDMGELGEDTQQQHQAIGCYAKAKALDHVFTLGKYTQSVAEAFGDQGIHFHSCEQMVKYLLSVVNEDMAVLVKGSRSAQMEKVVHALTAAEATHYEHH